MRACVLNTVFCPRAETFHLKMPPLRFMLGSSKTDMPKWTLLH